MRKARSNMRLTFGVQQTPGCLTLADTTTQHSISLFTKDPSLSGCSSAHQRTHQEEYHCLQHASPMGNTQAKLAPIIGQGESGAKLSTLKRQASPSPPESPYKRRALTLKVDDSGHAKDELSGLSEENTPSEVLRDVLDQDEHFLELPQLFDLVGVVAKKFRMDD